MTEPLNPRAPFAAALLICGLASSSVASAQTTPPPAGAETAPAAAPSAAEAPPSAPPTAPAPPAGNCIPECAPGSQCNADGTCSLTAASPLAAYDARPPEERGRKISLGEKSGFFMQGRLNASYLFITDTYDPSFDGGDGGLSATDDLSGVLYGISFLIGGAPGGGFVLGGGFDYVSGSVSIESTLDSSYDADAAAGTLFVFGQKYFGPFYIRALLGLLGAFSTAFDTYGGFTYGGGLGADISLSSKWSVGGGINLLLYSASYDDDFDSYSGEESGGMFSFTVGATLF